MPPSEEKKVAFEGEEVVEVAGDESDSGSDSASEDYELTWQEKQADTTYGTPLRKSERVSLKDAVIGARRQTSPLKHYLEDRARGVWNTLCYHEGNLETGAVAIAIAMLVLRRRYGVGAKDVLDVVKALGTAEGWRAIDGYLRGMGEGVLGKFSAVELGVSKQVTRFWDGVEEVGREGQRVTKHVVVGVEKKGDGLRKVASMRNGVVPGH
jgi:hypothetical protein